MTTTATSSPLIIRRTATIYSLSQLDEPLAKGQLEAPNCAVREVGGTALPLYTFPSKDGFTVKRIRSFADLDSVARAVPDVEESRMYLSTSEEDATSMDGASDAAGGTLVPQRSVLDMLVLAEWEDRVEKGLFRYDVTACPTKMVPGSYGFVAQLNEGRGSKKRPTEFRVDKVVQPFDANKFNFTKALQKEVLFAFEPGTAEHSKGAFVPTASASNSPNLVLINVSPIEYGHILLVPKVLDELSQMNSPEHMLLALHFAHEVNNPYFRMGFNSLGAYATINHLHYQGYYLSCPYAIERALTRPLVLGSKEPVVQQGVSVHELVDYPTKAIVFEAGDSLSDLADVVGAACQRLTAANIPHNLLIADCGARVFLYPNRFAERKARGEVPEDVLETEIDPATFEGAGHMLCKRAEDYEAMTQQAMWRLLAMASLTEEEFPTVAALALGLAACG